MLVVPVTTVQEVLDHHAQLAHGRVQLPYQQQHLVLTVLLVNIILVQLKQLIHVVFVQMGIGQ